MFPGGVFGIFLAGGGAGVYGGAGGGFFDRARQAEVSNTEGNIEPPLGAEDRRSYQSELNHLVAGQGTESGGVKIEKWAHLFRNTAPAFDAQGRPILRIQRGEEVASVGVSPSNILDHYSANRFTQQLLEARLQAELRRGPSLNVSASDAARACDFLQKSRNNHDTEASVRPNRNPQTGSSPRLERAGNRP